MMQHLSLLTDLYQLTMANGYRKASNDLYRHEAVFHLYFRKNPFGGDFAIACGLQLAIEYLQNLHFSEQDVTYLANLKGIDNKPLFDEHFLNFLQRFKFTCSVDAIEEGTRVFPNQPLMRIQGELWQAQLIETTLLNILNFSTLIATKSARVRAAAEKDSVLEFGLRRAQGVDGGLMASRAAYIGGCDATSNVMAGQQYGIPVRGTHAHSWVMAFEDELTAFRAYADAMPNNCTFLVDTYNTVQGIKNAIIVGNELRIKGYDLQGIRLDSGDLAALSIVARMMLDEAGFQKTNIVASNDLDEYSIKELKAKGAKINVWGIGTKLVTAYDQPALGGVYKLGAIRPNSESEWQYKVKYSEDPIKISTAGVLGVWRMYGKDVIYDISEKDDMKDGKDLLIPIFEKGKLVYQNPTIHQIREKSLVEQNSSIQTVVFSEKLTERKIKMTKKGLTLC